MASRNGLHLFLTGAQPRHLPQRTGETGQRAGAALGLGALLRFQMTAADDHLDQGQFALDRARYPLDQKRARRRRRIVDTLDRGALDARAGLILAPHGCSPRALPAQSGLRRAIVIIHDDWRVIHVARGGGDRRLARGDGGACLARWRCASRAPLCRCFRLRLLRL
ncbi:hypothetical protein [Nitrobacter sp. Nb-311A]|uniref:hypothetical protein n=1 Tax=Nitrobacter sp. Nb-311A TaxID=314253 RepID=UPI0013EF8027|nr:hypothetical protein [Nitrobacter sp. Nb-311A]